MLKDIWNLPRVSDSINFNQGFLENCEALLILRKFLFHLVFPYICIDLSFSEKIEHLSTASHYSHIPLALYKQAGKEFIPTGLYTDLIIMVKNVIFVSWKQKLMIQIVIFFYPTRNQPSQRAFWNSENNAFLEANNFAGCRIDAKCNAGPTLKGIVESTSGTILDSISSQDWTLEVHFYAT